MENFVQTNSIVRKIWGKSDTVLFIFAGAAAEFALNKAVDWLYFTGKLPADPIGRLFSTVTYARIIIFSDKDEAYRAINKITSIHQGVEKARGSVIPDWAYRDVLFMLIHYSIASFELLERKLTLQEKEEIYHVFFLVGSGMYLKSLPLNYKDWIEVREKHMEENLQKSNYTVNLYEQYRKSLGNFRYKVLVEAQKLVVPIKVRSLMQLNDVNWLSPVVPIYKLSRYLKLDGIIKTILLPGSYKKQIKELDIVS